MSGWKAIFDSLRNEMLAEEEKDRKRWSLYAAHVGVQHS
jgi:hypothetical protein